MRRLARLLVLVGEEVEPVWAEPMDRWHAYPADQIDGAASIALMAHRGAYRMLTLVPGQLTPDQRRIVEWGDGRLVVIAGAGTGKTRLDRDGRVERDHGRAPVAVPGDLAIDSAFAWQVGRWDSFLKQGDLGTDGVGEVVPGRPAGIGG